jgi:ABC-2 type transport system permease protein
LSAVGIVARKELRAYFESSVALIFLAIFLIATLFSFFGTSGFFARNIADARPLFAWLPALLILLVAAISMRQWAEERKMGTLEVLLTLPVRTGDMVLGKFVAGTALLAIALALTLPIPILVATLGPLDWGPVIGGYLGALLLGASYLAIGLCVSARTDNQVVSLMLTGVICGALYLLGSDQVTALVDQGSAEALRALGTGSRFTSIERGVLDVRDLVYYAGLAGFFLALNVYSLESERIDRGAAGGRRRLHALLAVVALVGANVLLLNVWLAPVTALRVDLTEGGEYSVSDVTRETLASLDQPLRISGYFSERTHPLLAPLVPQIRDMLAEYEIAGDGRVLLEFADPGADEALEQEIGERFGVRSVPFQVADRHQRAVVNSFFHVLIRYGDQHETLSFEELIDVHFDGDDLDVRLKSLEYDLTRTIKRVSRDFQNIESLMARLPDGVRLTLYVTPETLPDDFGEVPGRVREAAREIEAAAHQSLNLREVDPSGDPALAQRLAEELGVRPLAVDLFGQRTFYLDLILEAGDRVQRISPRSELEQAELRGAIEAAIRRATPGQLKTVGLYTQTPPAPPRNPQLPPQLQPPPPQPDYRGLQQLFGEDHRVEKLDLVDGVVPDHIDVLIVGKPGSLSEEAQFAIDQYVMRGGKLIVLAGRYVIDPSHGRGLSAVPHASPLFDMLRGWGIDVPGSLVMDSQNAAFPIPVEEQRGMFRVQRVRMIPYPFFIDVRSEGMTMGHAALAGVQNVTTPWASPLVVTPAEGVEAEVLLRSSPASWLNETGRIEPDFARHPDTGFVPGSETGEQTLAASLSGRFESHFANRPSPLFRAAEGESNDGGDATGRTLKQSLPDARVTVIGSAEIVSDLLLQLATQMGGEVHRGNIMLVQNLIDWSVEDTDLLSIRTSGRFARTLRPLESGEARVLELGCYAVSALGLAVVTMIPRRRARRVRALALPATETSS